MHLSEDVFPWLLRLGIVEESELDAPPGGPFLLKREAAQEFENGARVARLLQLLSVEGAGTLDTLKDMHTPVAKLYNWNLLLPILRKRGLDVDQDMKVLIVAGDVDIVADVLAQLREAEGDTPPGDDAARVAGMISPASAAEATSVAQLIAFCCEQLLGCSWSEALSLASDPSKLRHRLTLGAGGDTSAVVRWHKLVFAQCKLLVQLCDTTETERALALVSGGLTSQRTEVAMWSSRLLCRLAGDLSQRGLAAQMWKWFAGPQGGASALVEVWNQLPHLHAAGALMPLVLHLSGEKLHLFLAKVLPRYLVEPAAYLSFVAELLPLLAAAKGTREFMLRSGALTQLLQRALQAARTTTALPATRGLALELLAQSWSLFTREVQSIKLDPPSGAESAQAGAAALELGGDADPGAGDAKEASAQIVSELKRGCRDANLELQLTSHMALCETSGI